MIEGHFRAKTTTTYPFINMSLLGTKVLTANDKEETVKGQMHESQDDKVEQHVVKEKSFNASNEGLVSSTRTIATWLHFSSERTLDKTALPFIVADSLATKVVSPLVALGGIAVGPIEEP